DSRKCLGAARSSSGSSNGVTFPVSVPSIAIDAPAGDDVMRSTAEAAAGGAAVGFFVTGSGVAALVDGAAAETGGAGTRERIAAAMPTSAITTIAAAPIISH